MSAEDEPPIQPATVARPRALSVALAVAAVLVIVAANLIVTRSRHRGGGTPAVHHDGGAAIRAPEGPHVPTAIANGVRLTGLVVDGAGIPVGGAEVSAEVERGAVDRGLAPAARDAGVVDGPASSFGGADGRAQVPAVDAAPPDAGAAAVVVSAPTGSDGRFALEGLAPGRYRLRVTGAGLLAAEVRYVPVPSDEARIVVARQVSIDGTVSDGGKPVPAALVGIRGDAIGGTIEAKTDATGAFHAANLPEGRYQVYAWQGALAARAVRVSRLGAGPFPPLELRLEAGTIVIGRVIDRDEGTGLVAAIELRPSGDDQAPRYTRSGEDGAFRIEGIPNGRWIADAFVPGYLSPGGVELEAGRGVPELQLARGGTIEGRVVDGDGRPIAGASVRALTAGSNPTEYSAQVEQDRLRRFSGRTAAPPPDANAAAGDPQFVARGELGVTVGPIPPIPPPGAEVARPAMLVDASLAGEPPPLAIDPARASIWLTDRDGKYRVRGIAKAKVTVLAVATGFAEARSRALAIAPGETIPGVDVVLTPGTFIVGKVTDQHGVPVVGAELSAQPEVGAPVEGFSDGEGTYRLGPVAGAVELRVTAYGHVDLRRQLELPPPRGQTPAEHREDIVLEIADAVLAGTLDDTTGAPVAGAHLEVIGGAGEGRHAIVAADGTFSIDLLPRGHLRVRVDHPAYPPDELDAVASSTGERVRLHLAIGGAVEGALLDGSSGAPLASVTLAATGPGNQTIDASTDKSGLWKLGPLRAGHWRLEAKLPGYLTQTRELDVPAARTPGTATVRDVRIDLARGALLGGTVRDARGSRMPNAHVVVRLADGSGTIVEGDSDVQGEFRIHDCPTGDVVVTATHGDAAGATRATVRPGDEVLGLAIDLR